MLEQTTWQRTQTMSFLFTSVKSAFKNRPTPQSDTSHDSSEEINLSKEELQELEALVSNITSPHVQVLLRGYKTLKPVQQPGLMSSMINKILPRTESTIIEYEEQMLKQIELRDALLEERALVRGEESPAPDGESPKPFERIAYEAKLIAKRIREEKNMRNNRFYCEGEHEALKQYESNKTNNILRIPLKPTSTFDCTGEEIHFRVIESQIINRGAINLGYADAPNITSITYVVNPLLAHKFEEQRLAFAKKYDMLPESVKPLLLFHGTKPQNIDPITTTNFSIAKLGGNTGNKGYCKLLFFT
jgi:hypothetical protein